MRQKPHARYGIIIAQGRPLMLTEGDAVEFFGEERKHNL